MKKFNEQRNVIGNLIKEYREKKNYNNNHMSIDSHHTGRSSYRHD